MKHLRTILLLLIIAGVLATGLWWYQSSKAVPGEVLIENLSQGHRDGTFSIGDLLRVSYFIKNPYPDRSLTLTLDKQYNQRFGFREDTLLIDGQASTDTTITIAPGGDPVLLSYEVIANETSGNPRSVLGLRTSTTAQAQTLTTTTNAPTLTYCPTHTILHNRDTMFVLEGTSLEQVTTLSLGNLTITPNKQENQLLWLNIPAQQLPNGNHTIRLTTANGTTTTDCALTVTTYTTPIGIDLVPATIIAGSTKRLLLQGEVLSATTALELRGPSTITPTFSILDDQTLDLILPENPPLGTYTLHLSDGKGWYPALTAPISITSI